MVAQVTAATAHGYLLIPGGPGFSDVYSGDVLCEASGTASGIANSNTCGTSAISIGAIFREGHTFVLTHGVTAINAVASVGFKLSYFQIPCGNSIGDTTPA
jgi:hypothetical protein